MKKFTVIIPCHNAADYIEVCMEHIFHQTIGFENIEVILIDDVSSAAMSLSMGTAKYIALTACVPMTTLHITLKKQALMTSRSITILH